MSKTNNIPTTESDLANLRKAYLAAYAAAGDVREALRHAYHAADACIAPKANYAKYAEKAHLEAHKAFTAAWVADVEASVAYRAIESTVMARKR